MGVLFLTLVVFRLCIWQLQLMVLKVFANRSLKKNIHNLTVGYAQNLLKLAECYLGLKLVFNYNGHRRNLNSFVADHESEIGTQFMVISNHQSLIDIIAVIVAFPRIQTRFVAKKELGKWFPAASFVLREGGHALIDRKKNLQKTAADLKSFARRSYTQGYSPIIFPEGTRSTTGDLGAFNAGAARILMNSISLPVVVLAVDGGSQASHLLKLRRGSKIIYTVTPVSTHPPVSGKKEITRLLTSARDKISEQLSSRTHGC